jgi:exonuclease VII small subunit
MFTNSQTQQRTNQITHEQINSTTHKLKKLINSKTQIMAKQEMKYEEAVAQLEAIVRRMETGELDLDSQTEELKKAQKLIKLCKDKLTKTDEEIKKMLEEEG